MIFAHSLIGVILAYLAFPLISKQFNIKKLQKYKKAFLYIPFILGSVFPDIDFAYLFLVDRHMGHRQLLTHSIIPYAILLLICVGLSLFSKSVRNYLYLGISFFIGITSHLVADMYIDPVYLFSPISKAIFLIQPFAFNPDAGIKGYLFSPYGFTEILIIICGMSVLINSFYKSKKEFILMLGIIGIIETSAILALIPYINSFN